MKIIIASDHNGPELKKEIIRFLKRDNHEIIDMSPTNSSIDNYPEYAFTVGKEVAANEGSIGILICGTGIGMSIAANKVKGIRCAHVSNLNDASLARKHNHANIIAISKNNPVNDAIKMIDIFVNTNYSKEERHVRRVNMINNYENGEYNV